MDERAVKFAYKSGFWPWWIQWCDRHLCHVTSDDAYRINIVLSYSLLQVVFISNMLDLLQLCH